MYVEKPHKLLDEYEDLANDNKKKWMGQRDFRYADTTQEKFFNTVKRN